MRGPRRRRRVLFVLLAVLAAVAGAAGLAAWRLADERGDLLNQDVPFAGPDAPREGEKREKRRRKRPVEWPLYGFNKPHTRVYKPRKRIRGPYRDMWRHRAPALLEFPPVIFRGAIYQLADNGQLYSLRKRTGKVRWKRDLGHLSAASPAVGGASVYVTLLERRRGLKAGRVVKLKQKNGKIDWSRKLPSRSESSVLLHRGRIFFGSEDGTVYKLNAHNGRIIWTYRAGGAVKGSPALSRGVLYFGDYGGYVHAIRAGTGRRVWRAAPARQALRGGRFYATAAVKFGRVYIGATDGREYSLSTRDGRVAWARQTGAYVYASAAVQDVPGLGPTVFVGSYDGNFYAFDARTGDTRWRHRSGGRISGSATIIGDVVYFSDLGKHNTIGLRTRTGKVVFRRGHGAFDPMVSDGRYLFHTGRSSLTAMLPRRDPRARAARRRAIRRLERRRERRNRRTDLRRARAGLRTIRKGLLGADAARPGREAGRKGGGREAKRKRAREAKRKRAREAKRKRARQRKRGRDRRR